MVRIGFPLASIGIMYTVVYLALARIAGTFGTPALAALGIVNRMESAAYLAAHALGIATSTLVGQNLGAGLAERAGALAARADRLAMGVGAIAFLLFLLVPGFLMRLFSDDPATIAVGTTFLRITALCQIPQVWELVYEGGLTGAGRTLPAMLISIPISVVRIPLAWIFSGPLGFGPPGIWWTISLTAILRGALMRWWWSRGTWMEAGEIPQPTGAGTGGTSPEDR
jgi:Na+-driven multidrug efflux pump